MRRVVITGMGIYSCIGKNQDEVKDSLFQGRSGIGIDPARKEGSPDKPGGLSIQLCKSEKKEFYIRYSS